MQEKTRKSPFISSVLFGGIWTYQRVMSEKIKKYSPALTRALGCDPGGLSNSRRRFAPGCGPARRFR
jgi:hypothetical protein